VSVLRTIVQSSRALVTTAKDMSRLREIARVFWRHGFGTIIRKLRIQRDLQLDDEATAGEVQRGALASADTGKRLVKAFTELGPTWVKFGQILSTRPDLLGPEVVAELASLQDAVGPVAFEEVESQLRRNLGEGWRRQFESVDENPLASASIGQVHRARLVDGTEVVLKIQRPGIRPIITSDLHILHAVAGYIEDAFEEARAMALTGMVEDFAKSLEQELDYRAEANNTDLFRANFVDDPRVKVPDVYREHSGPEVLCLEYIPGKKFTQIIAEGRETTPLVEAYFDMAYRMLFIHGFFHGDLHPGNVFILDDDSLVLIDCGMVGRLAPSRKERVIDIMWAVLNQDLESVARTLYDLAIPLGPVDYGAFEADAIAIAERYIVGVPLSQIQMGEFFSALVSGATRHNVRMPTDFTMMFKAIMTTEGLAKTIAPNVDPIELAKPFIHEMVTERYSPERIKQMALADFSVLSGMLRTVPRQLPRLLDEISKGDLTFGVSDDTLEAQARALDRRTGRSIRTAFAIAYMVCGTVALAIPGLSTAFWGVPWVSLVFYGLAAFGILTLMRRGALL